MIRLFQRDSPHASATQPKFDTAMAAATASADVKSTALATVSALPMPALPALSIAGRMWQAASDFGSRLAPKWLQFGRPKKRLQMIETVALGEKRFIGLVQVDGRQFLIGGAPGNIGMLTELAPDETFHQVLKDATKGLNAPAASTTTVVKVSAAGTQPLTTPRKLPNPRPKAQGVTSAATRETLPAVTVRLSKPAQSAAQAVVPTATPAAIPAATQAKRVRRPVAKAQADVSADNPLPSREERTDTAAPQPIHLSPVLSFAAPVRKPSETASLTPETAQQQSSPAAHTLRSPVRKRKGVAA